MTTVVVRGIGDIGSAVAHRLFTEGYRVILHASPQPTDIRREMAYTNAVFGENAVLEGVCATRVDTVAMLPTMLTAHAVIPVVVTDLTVLLPLVLPQVLIDARMRKHAHPEVQRGLAPLTIGLGPNFCAGETTDVAIETQWGEALGTVLTQGGTQPLAGEPRPIAGVARARYVYAPCAGVFRTPCHIGESVCAGHVIACCGSTALLAPLPGVLRGLTHDNVLVETGTKVIEVDPRGAAAVVTGISKRPARIADGVLQAVRQRVSVGAL